MSSFNKLITVEDSHGEYDTYAEVEYSGYGSDLVVESQTYTDKAGNTVDLPSTAGWDSLLSEAAYQHAASNVREAW